MKVMAINSSPRGGGKSKTEWMLNHLVTGMREAGAQVEVFHLRKKKINYCIGCFTCWSKTPGKCLHKDDMALELLPKYNASDVVVFATPLYYHTVNAQVKAFIERTLPTEEGFVVQEDGDRARHPFRQDPPKTVWLSAAGMPQPEAFEQLSLYVRHLHNKQLIAEIYRTAAESMMHPGNEAVRERVAQAIRQAGIEIVEKQAVSNNVMACIEEPLFDSFESFQSNVNMFWTSCIAEGVTPEEFIAKGLMPRPDSVAAFMALLTSGFNSERARGTQLKLQFVFSGEVEGDCHAIIDNGAIDTMEGRCPDPDLTVQAPFELWLDIMQGKADGRQMLEQQKYKVEGNLSLMEQMGQLFG